MTTSTVLTAAEILSTGTAQPFQTTTSSNEDARNAALLAQRKQEAINQADIDIAEVERQIANFKAQIVSATIADTNRITAAQNAVVMAETDYKVSLPRIVAARKALLAAKNSDNTQVTAIEARLTQAQEVLKAFVTLKGQIFGS